MSQFSPQLKSQNIKNTTKTNSNGFKYEEIFYELVAIKSPDIITKLKTCVFFENGKWKRVVKHPVLFCAVIFSKFFVGIIYLLRKRK